MSERRLTFELISGGYGTTTIVRQISGEATAGQVLCVLGRNGVGKSTLLKILFGYLPCWSGQVAFDGRPINELDPPARRALGISYCPQERIVFDDLTVRENLLLMHPTRSLVAFEPYFAGFPILERRLGQHAGTLSGGEKKILSFVRGLGEAQPVVLLDEPTEGVQPENIALMEAAVAERKAAGTAFVIVEQNLAFAERIADHYLLMDQGRAVLYGPRSEIPRAAILQNLHV